MNNAGYNPTDKGEAREEHCARQRNVDQLPCALANERERD
jgi:hypothetical protein